MNRGHWDEDEPNWVADGEHLWRSEPTWGMWGVPIRDLLPDDVDALELGCGTGYVTAWVARRGATVVGIDNSTGNLQSHDPRLGSALASAALDAEDTRVEGAIYQVI